MIEINYTLFTILLTAASMGLGLALWSMRRKKKEVETERTKKGNRLEQAAHNYQAPKKYIGNVSWIFDKATTIGSILAIGHFLYQFNEGRAENAGIMAAFACAVYFSLLLKSDKAPGAIAVILKRLFIACYFIFEAVTISGGYTSQSSSKKISQQTEIKEQAKAKIETLKNDKLIIQNSSVSDAVKMYKKSEIDKRIAAAEVSANTVIENDEDKFFNSATALLSTDSETLYNIMLAILLVFSASLIANQSNGYWCNLSLHIHMKGVKKNLAMMDQYRAGTVSGNAGGSEKPSVEDNQAHANSDKFDSYVDKMTGFLAGKADGFKVTGKVIKSETSATDAQVKQIRKQLKKMKWLSQGVNGGAAQYLKSTPKSIEKPAEITAEPAKKAKVFNIFRR
jgi:hypothetical protein